MWNGARWRAVQARHSTLPRGEVRLCSSWRNVRAALTEDAVFSAARFGLCQCLDVASILITCQAGAVRQSLLGKFWLENFAYSNFVLRYGSGMAIPECSLLSRSTL